MEKTHFFIILSRNETDICLIPSYAVNFDVFVLQMIRVHVLRALRRGSDSTSMSKVIGCEMAAPKLEKEP